MCGIFAYAGSVPPETGHLAAAASGAARRGPHGHGWIARNPDGRHHLHTALGPLTHTALHRIPATATALLGHARMATVGRYDDPDALQPWLVNAADGRVHAVVHNGNVYNADRLSDRPGAVTDSHALALAYADLRAAGLTPPVAIKALVDRAQQHAWVIAVLDSDGRLYGHRHRHPLYTCTAGSGAVYWTSQPCCRTAVPLPELTVFTALEGS
ncbi:class II glutamine amidotransferase [Micromonospora sp. WMMC273]|uniref:class II glutamine amidotransferase n=1 Tax=Micromonospora sp. WMMC273 TaxID=3015157 RepID=UPI0022B66959|nr:hypothetical protein [Micromonospora sp. WMMC273]MCZ7478810.1 hypothetical protein [Micromonospora sp. WMMC273]MCZ7478938.1 hypothetical protein [Micromonospora sp. WMMC273]MCZ7478999.1 hypothetical protein [Micromonospora sp. WMMC273]